MGLGIGGSDSDSLMKLQSRCQLGLQPSKELNGAAAIQRLDWGWTVCLQDGSLTWLLATKIPCHIGKSRGYLSILTTWWLGSPRANHPRERARQAPQYILQPSLGSDILSLPLCSTGHTDLSQYSVRGDYTRVWIPGGGAEATIEVQCPVWTSASTIGPSCSCLSMETHVS